MASAVAVDIFVEDRAHEAFLLPMPGRIAREEQFPVLPRVRTGRGGYGRGIHEFQLYQDLASKGIVAIPDLLLVAIDGNCASFAEGRQRILEATQVPFSDRLVVACPDPHVEKWYLADPQSFRQVVGATPTIPRKKCERNFYKGILAKALRQAGHPATLGGVEFARELVEQMNLYRAAKNDRSLKAFIDDLRARLRAFGL